MQNSKFLFSIISIIVLSVIVSFGQNSATQLKVEGLKQEVTIRRDARGIPYIEAKNDEDLYFAQGFVMAQDRLWQMNLLRRVVRGETAEIFGNRTLEEDKRWRRYNFAKIAEEGVQLSSPSHRVALESYAKGVNAYIATLDDKTLPPEFKILGFKPAIWTPADTIMVGKTLADGLSSTWRNDLLRAAMKKSFSPEKYAEATNGVTPYDVVLFGNDAVRVKGQRSKVKGQKSKVEVSEIDLKMAEKDAIAQQGSLEKIGLYAEDLAASNNWVISGKRTADGKAILANDPHLQPSTPNIWYLVHLSTPTMRVSGVTTPGAPGVVIGHNDSIAWGLTNVAPDIQDLYLETFNAEGKYQTPTGWESPKIRKEEIKVRKGLTSTETETVTFEVVETRHGPIFTEEGGQKYALKWTALNPKNQEFEAFYWLNRAKNWVDFQNGIKTYGGAMQNFIYADTKGNIGWMTGGRIPIRKKGDGSVPYDGATNDGEWGDYVPFEELPKLYNPPQGFIVTANQRTVGKSFKYQHYYINNAAPWRARRIYDLINANPKITVNDVTTILRESYSMAHVMLSQEIIKLNAASPETLAVLKNWDGKMSADSKAALLINTIRNLISDKIAEESKPLPGGLIRERILHFIIWKKSAEWLPKGFANYTEFFKECDKQARESLQKQLGSNESKWVWGAQFKSNFPHVLAAAPLVGQQFATPSVGIDGSSASPNVGSNVSMRFITTPLNWDNTRHVIPMGQSGLPNSPHYKDQFDSWRQGELPIFPFSKNAVETAAKQTLVLSPK